MTTRPGAPAGAAYYQLDATVQEYLAFHYPDPARDPLEALLGPRTPPLRERFPFAAAGLAPARPSGRALDVGCACGRVTFELARTHRLAVGIDLSARLVAAARAVQSSGRARYRTVLEGDLLEEHDVAAPAAPNARFAVADALRLPFRPASFDTVAALHLLDRVPDPGRALDELERVVAPGGTLLLASPWTWLDPWTPPERRLGGFRRGGEAVRGADTVRARLAGSFRAVREVRMPFYIPHHARSGQLGTTQILVFERTSGCLSP